ncbi:hypothetical protein KC332_g3284 [Hortaea werneckii]|uniref:RRM domain-containing protein n=1 Tax=Hortaea werneckii EXF-2000 TaxID=1157616 RepID=A0A1Z5T6S3_HORWE|nr:hypothetical protein KC358_g6375 [Hortaea werneckii]OTA31541.1 hypothetical protein BTJ68_08486 [Hortaea werneckii EXF-2000]KAI6930851.1 hypothetical protein KC341_g9959 [Hortaea werneckii]KAI6932535.1 hypothetical protein KC348_g6961 [Hortaea werneckii]KAI6965763.1 hypothetical protein KC321_g9937 [Hortaea werneckii]
MDRSLDEIISERPPVADHLHPALVPAEVPHRRGLRAGRSILETAYESRIGWSKMLTDSSDWVHDRFEDDRYDRTARRRAGPADYEDRYDSAGARGDSVGTKLRVDNVHYELTEDDLRGLFERKGPLLSVKLNYDRMDRSTGMAYVTYADYRDARDAVEDYDGQNANGLPIKVTILPQAPAAATRGPSLFDRIERPPRSLFDRLDSSAREDSREGFGRRRRERSDSPRKSRAMAERVDRYVPRSRSPPTRRRGPPRESGRRPGQRREDNGRRGGRRPRTDEEGRPLVGGRPKKTADELDAEMDDYFNSGKGDDGGKANGAAENGSGAATAPAPAGEEDTDMVL